MILIIISAVVLYSDFASLLKTLCKHKTSIFWE